VGRKAQRTRLKLIEAGRDVALEAGTANLTLAMVARRAGVSKGGVLYHFQTKALLLQALLDFLVDGFEEQVDRIRTEQDCSWLTAYLRASFPEEQAGQVRETDILFQLVTVQPELGERLQERFHSWHGRAEERGLSAVEAHLYRCAIDGLWYNEMFGFNLPREQLTAVLGHLEELIRRTG
jgi:AcrR family transcriptional regulator